IFCCNILIKDIARDSRRYVTLIESYFCSKQIRKEHRRMIQVLFLILIWVLPALLMMNTYVKMNESEKQSFKVELKQPIVFFTVVFLLFGLLISLSGIILAIKWVQHLGVIMVF